MQPSSHLHPWVFFHTFNNIGNNFDVHHKWDILYIVKKKFFVVLYNILNSRQRVLNPS